MKDCYRCFFGWLLKIGKFSWIVSSDNDPGFRVFGVNVYFYKWYYRPMIYRATGSENEPAYRVARKCEIGLLKVDPWGPDEWLIP